MDGLVDQHGTAFLGPGAAPGVGPVVVFRAQAAHLDAGGEHGAESAGVDELLQVAVHGVKAVLEDAGEDELGMPGVGRAHLLDAVDGGGERLFAQHVLAGVEGGNGDRGVGGMVGADADGVQLRIRQDVLQVVGDVGDRECIGQALGLFFHEVARPDDLDAFHLLVTLHMGGGDYSAADNADAYPLAHHLIPLVGCHPVVRAAPRPRNHNLTHSITRRPPVMRAG